MPFEIGDIVHLKGGGPRMTVTQLGKNADGSQYVTCTWFDDSENEKKGAYPEAALERRTRREERRERREARRTAREQRRRRPGSSSK